jgi:hypothetical protein
LLVNITDVWCDPPNSGLAKPNTDHHPFSIDVYLPRVTSVTEICQRAVALCYATFPMTVTGKVRMEHCLLT